MRNDPRLRSGNSFQAAGTCVTRSHRIDAVVARVAFARLILGAMKLTGVGARAVRYVIKALLESCTIEVEASCMISRRAVAVAKLTRAPAGRIHARLATVASPN